MRKIPNETNLNIVLNEKILVSLHYNIYSKLKYKYYIFNLKDITNQTSDIKAIFFKVSININ